jgi:Tlde1 domain
LVRVGEALVAAGVAALTSISLCAWMMQDSTPADAVARADYSSDSPATTGAIASFDARFIDPSAASSELLRPTLSFADRFGTATPSRGVAAADPAASNANVAVPERASRLAAAAPLPRPAPNRSPPRYRLASLGDTPLPTAYAPPESASKDSGITDLLKKLTLRDPAGDAAAKDAAPKDAGPLADDPAHTAIYDISARTVYLPNGERLEAHSGLGGSMDDVRSVHLRSRGPTPPNVYELTLREAPFHGVQAIRLVPVDGNKMYGRDGILVHPFMLGPEGASNGCVSVKDYPAFLNAYQRGDITRLVVVEQLDDPLSARTAADWFSNTMKRIFGRS